MKITCYTDIILDKNDINITIDNNNNIHITIDNNKYVSQE